MELLQHDKSFFIRVNGDMLMHSRRHQSELDLARLGCAHIEQSHSANVLIGGLGLGYTLRQCLNHLGPTASVTVCELMDAVVDWNNQYLGALADYPLRNKRTRVARGDIVQFLLETHEHYDAILLDVDNGPAAMTDSGNWQLYNSEGISLCHRALAVGGCLAVWSAGHDSRYERDLVKKGFTVGRYRAPAHDNDKSDAHIIWVARKGGALLPPGGKMVKFGKMRGRS